MASGKDDVLQRIKALQDSHELSIIKLSEPISAIPIKSGEQRQSDISADAVDSASPASLEADLSHYKVGEVSICPNTLLIQSAIGTLLKTTILLPRTSHEREVFARHRRRTTLDC